jgi:CheY-like chemotaxis protein
LTILPRPRQNTPRFELSFLTRRHEAFEKAKRVADEKRWSSRAARQVLGHHWEAHGCTEPQSDHWPDALQGTGNGRDLCAQAADASEAISLAKRYKPDSVILDPAMPKMNGLETARELKKIMPTVPIVLHTIHASSVQELFAGDSCVDLVVAQRRFRESDETRADAPFRQS